MPKGGTRIWRENRKSWKTKNTHCRTWIMARKLKKNWKMAQEHCTTGNMARNTEEGGKGEMHTV